MQHTSAVLPPSGWLQAHAMWQAWLFCPHWLAAPTTCLPTTLHTWHVHLLTSRSSLPSLLPGSLPMPCVPGDALRDGARRARARALFAAGRTCSSALSLLHFCYCVRNTCCMLRGGKPPFYERLTVTNASRHAGSTPYCCTRFAPYHYFVHPILTPPPWRVFYARNLLLPMRRAAHPSTTPVLLQTRA